MEMTSKVWMLSSALLFASACSDDDPDSPAAASDGGRDSAQTTDPSTADTASIDSGLDSGSIDAGLLPEASTSDATVVIDSAAPDSSVAKIEVLGTWHTNFASTETVTEQEWGEYYDLLQFDNTKRVAILQDKPVMGVPGKFNRNVWTPIVDGSFYYCTVDFGLETLEAALASTTAPDATDPANGGCGGFLWTKMSPPIEIAGNWLQGTAPVLIDSDHLGEATVESYDNASNSAVTSGAAMVGRPPKFSKLRWIQPSATTLYICYVASNFNTAGDAADDTTAADPAQLTSGCLGAAWTAYTLAP